MKPTIHPMALALYGLASLKHSGQTRRDGETPYIEHIHDVLRISKAKDAFRQAIIIGHDLFEDTDATEEEVRGCLTAFKPDDAERIVGSIKELTTGEIETYWAFIDRLKRSPFAGIVVEIKRWDMAANLADSPSKKQLAKYGSALTQLGAE